MPIDLLTVPAARRAAILEFAPELVVGRSVALSTHLNADGDGCGSESALARLLVAHGLPTRIVNPTPWPEIPRAFKTPLVPLVPILGILSCLGLMAGLPKDTWLRLVIWLVIGFVIYFAYSRNHSHIGRGGTEHHMGD